MMIFMGVSLLVWGKRKTCGQAVGGAGEYFQAALMLRPRLSGAMVERFRQPEKGLGA
ncbi:hypothetical protein [Kingella oralis]|uniref:hypothetical protein n=1 Tax=Kingella oralis TaxID=505 RepID=UPI0034E46F7C